MTRKPAAARSSRHSATRGKFSLQMPQLIDQKCTSVGCPCASCAACAPVAFNHSVAPSSDGISVPILIGIDYLVGSIPVVGDVFDAAWKSNQMNVELLRRRASVSAEEAAHGRASDWLFLGVLVMGLLALLAGSIVLSLWLLLQLAHLLR